MDSSLRVNGRADPDLVWQRYVDLRNWARWSPQITSVDADGDTLRPGLHGTVHGIAGLRVRFEVASVDPVSREWTWVVHPGIVQLTFGHTVRPGAGGTGSSAALRVVGPPPVVLPYLPLARLALRRLVSP